jgi:Ni,Fe-hydrogenase III large subunit
MPAAADKAVSRLEARLVSLFATDERVWNGRFVMHHVWSLPHAKTFLRVAATIDPSCPVFPPIGSRHPAARWMEREVTARFGLKPQHEAGSGVEQSQLPVNGGFHAFAPVVGEGVSQVPVRRELVDVAEPGHFCFEVDGEREVYRHLRLFYVHQSVEKRFERLSWLDGLLVAESVAGDTVVGHALAYAHAIERLASVDVPPRPRALRALLLEFERILSHITDIAVFAAGRSLTIWASDAAALRDGLAGQLERLFANALLRGTVALGGVKHDLSSVARHELLTYLDRFEAEFEQLVRPPILAPAAVFGADGMLTLTKPMARDLGIVGIAARAAGIDADLRRDHPHDGYGTLRFEVPLETGGDVRARLVLRAREITQSLSIARQVLESLPETPLRVPLPDELPAFSSALGWAEAWRGPCFHWVATDERGGLSRVKVTDASSFNWPGLIESGSGGVADHEGATARASGGGPATRNQPHGIFGHVDTGRDGITG